MPQVLFAIESAQSRSLPLSAQRLVNLFTERQPPEAKSQIPIFGAPGLTLVSDIGTGPIRGMWRMQDVLFVVSGPDLYEVGSGGMGAFRGTGIFGTSNVSMADNGKQLCIVNGVSGWIYTPATTTFTPITSPNFNPAKTVTFFDGYFVFDHVGTNQFFISGIYDGLTYSGLDFASAESSPDFVVGTTQNLEFLFIFCEQHIELWYDAGGSSFPFQRYAGGVIPRGCIAPLSLIKQDNAVFFLGNDKVFYRMQGNVPIRVSTHPVEHAFAQYSDISQAFCFTYTLEGHKFINVTFPVTSHTWVYDISTEKWHERESLDEDGHSYGRWRANAVAEVYGPQTYIGDAFSGKIWLLDWTVYTEGGNTILGLAHSAPIHSDRHRVYISRFELDVQAGVGLTTGQGSDPQIMLRWSRDGGQTFSLPQPWRGMGRVGEYLRRLRWLRLGNARQWVFQLTITDPVPRVIIAAHADITVGMG